MKYLQKDVIVMILKIRNDYTSGYSKYYCFS